MSIPEIAGYGLKGNGQESNRKAERTRNNEPTLFISRLRRRTRGTLQ
jgi:hypothetical protein